MINDNLHMDNPSMFGLLHKDSEECCAPRLHYRQNATKRQCSEPRTPSHRQWPTHVLAFPVWHEQCYGLMFATPQHSRARSAHLCVHYTCT